MTLNLGVPQTYGFGNRAGPIVNMYPFPILAARAPVTGTPGVDNKFPIGQMWIRTTTNQAWILTSVVAGAANWALSSPGASDVDTLAGDGGGSISPFGGLLQIIGGTNLTTTGSNSGIANARITVDLDPAVVLATSISSPIYTAVAALDINAVAGSNITLQMGDAAGVNVIDFEDSTSATVATINSNGQAAFVNVDGILGAVAPAAATATTITANTSVTSPLYTAAAADALIQAGGVNDVVVRLGDAAGATFFRVQDSTTADVWTVDSNGVFAAFAGLTVTGAFAQTAGTFNVGQDNAANAINIGGGNVARAIAIGATGAHTVNIGNALAGAIAVDTAAGFSIDGANTSNITVTSAGLDLNIQGVGCAVNVTSTEAQNDAIVIESSAANGGVQIRAGTGGILIGNEVDTQFITLGNIAPTVGRIVTISSGTVVTAAVDDTVNIAPDGATTNANSMKTVNINTGGVTLGEVKTYIGTGAVTSGTHTTAIATGNRAAGTMTLNMFTGSGTKIANLGNVDGLTTFNIDAITLINDSVNVQTSINTGTSTGAVVIGNALAGAMTIDTAAGISLDAATASNFTVTGAFDLDFATTAGAMHIDSAGVLELNSSAGVIGIGNDAVAQNINIGTGAAARTITIGNNNGATSVVVDAGTGAASFGATATVHTTTVGSTSGASSTVLQAGTAGFTITGTINDSTSKFETVTGDRITFRASPIAQSTLDTCVIPTGVAATTDLLAFENGIIMEQFIIGTQAIFAPRMAAAGLTVSCDLTNAEGKEYNFGAARANSKHSFTIGTSAAFYMQLRFTVNDVSSCEPAYFGFRKTEANNAAYGAYTDFVAYGVNDGVAPGDCAISTRLNSGAQVDTDTNDAFADASTHTLRINVSNAGVVTFLFDGAPPTVTQAFSFDNGDVVHPFWTHLFNATVGAGDEIYWVSMEVGFQ